MGHKDWINKAIYKLFDEVQKRMGKKYTKYQRKMEEEARLRLEVYPDLWDNGRSIYGEEKTQEKADSREKAKWEKILIDHAIPAKLNADWGNTDFRRRLSSRHRLASRPIGSLHQLIQKELGKSRQ